MGNSTRRRNRFGWSAALSLVLVALMTVLAGCSGSSSGGSDKTTGVTITVALGSPPPTAALKDFSKQTGITVKWVNLDWDSLQTKISSAATANTYFADATDVDWSRVGQLAKLNWFYPMDSYLDTKSMASDMPQLASFTSGGHVIGIPYDASFMVTTVNTKLYKKAKVSSSPKTMKQYTAGLKKLKSSGVAKTPLNIPFSAAEGLSTYWYEATAAFGGTVLDDQGKPQFTTPDSAGYQAADWMVSSLKSGLVPAGNINVTDSQGQQTLMAKGQVASTFSDYSGNVGTLYNIKSSSSVVGDVKYLATPGVSGPAGNLSNPDGIGIPKQAKYPKAAAKFIDWFTSTQTQADFSGANGADKAYEGYPIPSRLSAVKKMTDTGNLAEGKQLQTMLKTSKPVFPGGAPSWYPQFSRAVYTNLHSAATGSMTVDAAIKAIAKTADQLSSDS